MRWAARWTTTTCRRCARSCARPPRDNYRFSAIVLGIVSSDAVPDASSCRGPGVGRQAGRAERPGRGARHDISSPKSICRAARSCAASGAALALPLLDAMIPAPRPWRRRPPHPSRTWASSTSRTARSWTSGRRPATGRISSSAPILKPLDAVQRPADRGQQSGQQAGREPRGARDRRRAPGCPACIRGSARTRHGGVTVDQIAAQHIGQDTPLPSLEVATEGTWRRRLLRSRLRLQLLGHAFRSARRPRRCRWRTTRASCSSGCSARATRRRSARVLNKQYASILDMVAAETRVLQRTLGPPDRAVLSDYLDSVREIERRMQKMESRAICRTCSCRTCRAPRRAVSTSTST